MPGLHLLVRGQLGIDAEDCNTGSLWQKDQGTDVSVSQGCAYLFNGVGLRPRILPPPFQNNLNFNAGPHKGTQNILNIQPVIPFHLNEDWNLITRTILPLIWSPSNAPGRSVPFGLGPASFTVFLSPRVPTNGWVWGAGPIVQLPTTTDPSLGSNVWGLGPAVVVAKTTGPIVAGVLVNNLVVARDPWHPP
jgi:hypothetical protein